MLEAISKMFDSTFPASFINFSFLPKYASYFVDGVTPASCVPASMWRCCWL